MRVVLVMRGAGAGVMAVVAVGEVVGCWRVSCSGGFVCRRLADGNVMDLDGGRVA